MKHNKLIKAFTLVELIVSIVILGILSTIAFLYFQDYPIRSRDTKRLSDMSNLRKTLEIYNITNGGFIMPESSVDVKVASKKVFNQGIAGESILPKLNFSGDGKDPNYKNYYTYTTTSDFQYAQIMGFFELDKKLAFLGKFLDKTYADSSDYKDRFPKLMGEKIGILTTNENQPIQEIDFIKKNGIDLLTTTGSYIGYISNSRKRTGNYSYIKDINPTYSCARIKEIRGPIRGDFVINPNGEDINVFCDSETDKTYYDFVEGGNLEDETPNFWLTGSMVTRTTEEAHDGNYSLKIHGINNYEPANFTYIVPGKKYKISGWFKGVSDNSDPIYLYYGFAEYDKDFKRIENSDVNAIAGTETTLSEDVKSSDKKIKFNCDENIYNKWQKGLNWTSNIAFNVDDSGEYNDLPNRDRSNHISSSDYKNGTDVSGYLTRSGNICTLNFHPNRSVKKNHKTGTKIRLHNSGGTYNYKGVSSYNLKIKSQWENFSGEVSGISKYGVDSNYFRRGTKFVKLVILPNYWFRCLKYNESGDCISRKYINENSTVYMDDLKMEVID